jgi:hypothetical protein
MWQIEYLKSPTNKMMSTSYGLILHVASGKIYTRISGSDRTSTSFQKEYYAILDYSMSLIMTVTTRDDLPGKTSCHLAPDNNSLPQRGDLVWRSHSEPTQSHRRRSPMMQSFPLCQ